MLDPQLPMTDEPLAVIGMSCRFPSAASLDAFWHLLLDGCDAIGPPPPWRAQGRSEGGYLSHVDLFDSEFFQISAREAMALDPQQRLILELAWEAIEDARIRPDTLTGSDTGVFVGSGSDDYAQLSRTGTRAPDAYTMTGTSRAFIANRVSFLLGLRGPSLTVDTGQSSSLVALHQASESLRRGECTVAVVGGVQLNLSAESERAVRLLGALSPSERCRTFDATADGIVRGEGGGVVVLKPLATAQADGDRIYCTLLASAVNNDGRGESLTAPSRTAQQEVLTTAYRKAGVAPRDVTYVELHGTGTKQGDPIEAAALNEVLGSERSDDAALLVGSVKTNIGHLEAAAGIAALIKTALSLHHGTIPRSLHYRSPNPGIDLNRMAVCTQNTPWPEQGPRLAGVSSFGLGGTNCHVVLRAAPPIPVETVERRPVGPSSWVLSGAGRAGLAARAGQLAGLLDDQPGISLSDVGLSLAVSRNAMAQRAAVVGSDAATLAAGLRALAAGTPHDGVFTGAPGTGGLAFLFPGQGMQQAGMGQQLYETFPVFAQTFDQISDLMEDGLGVSLHTLMWQREDWLDRLHLAQPALFALEVSLYRLFESWGLVPDWVIGHSQGEISVAHVTGILSLPDAAALIVERGRLLNSLPAGGAMTAVQATEAEVRAVIAEGTGVVSIAAVNSPEAVVVSGEQAAVDAVTDHFVALGRRRRPLRISRAGHSPLLDPIRDELVAFARTLTWQAPSGPTIISTVTGRPAENAELRTPEYWADHLCRTVRFADAVQVAVELGAGLFVEVGPGHGLTTMVGQTVAEVAGSLIAPLAGEDEWSGLAELVGRAQMYGQPIDWRAFYGPHAQLTDLPTYPFQRRRHWLDSSIPEAPKFRPAHRAPRVSAIPTLLASSLRSVLGLDPSTPIDIETPFSELGLDSRMSVEFRNRLVEATGLRFLPTTLLFECPTPDRLGRELADLVRHSPASPDRIERLG